MSESKRKIGIVCVVCHEPWVTDHVCPAAPAPTEPVTPEPCNCDKFYLEGNDHMPGCPKSSEPVITPEQPVTPTEGEREQARALLKGPYQLQIYFAGQRDPEPTDYGVEHIARALARTRAATWEEAAQVAEAEPELEGDPPLSVMHAIQRQGPVPVLRSTVAATKRSIAAAIRAKGGR